jgi:NAD(P)-dependent dehydrogenase (short-subunit alcohol dehydrogenase family)
MSSAESSASPEETSFGILVIGATGGIGQALVRRLTAGGRTLLMMGRDESRLRTLSEETGQRYIVGDATDWSATEKAGKLVVELTGGLSGAVNLAGSILLKPAHLTSADDFRNCIDANLTTAFGLVRTSAPLMRKSGGGSIVLLSTAATGIGLANHEAISAAKAGVEGLTISAAATYAGYGVRVNAVAPGLVETPLSEKIWSNPKAAEASIAMHPLGRFGKPNDIASAIEWLLSPEQTWITGQRIAIDGGLAGLKVMR